MINNLQSLTLILMSGTVDTCAFVCTSILPALTLLVKLVLIVASGLCSCKKLYGIIIQDFS